MHRFLLEEWIKAYIDEWNKIEGKESEAVELIVEKGTAKHAGKANSRKLEKARHRRKWVQELPCIQKSSSLRVP